MYLSRISLCIYEYKYGSYFSLVFTQKCVLCLFFPYTICRVQYKIKKLNRGYVVYKLSWSFGPNFFFIAKLVNMERWRVTSWCWLSYLKYISSIGIGFLWLSPPGQSVHVFQDPPSPRGLLWLGGMAVLPKLSLHIYAHLVPGNPTSSCTCLFSPIQTESPIHTGSFSSTSVK